MSQLGTIYINAAMMMRFIKFIHNVSKWCHFVVNMYAQNILPCIKFPNLQTRRRHQLTLKLMYTIKHKMLPNYLIDIFTSTNEIHDYSTRQSEFNFALPKPNTN
jgi:hypothetical protein